MKSERKGWLATLMRYQYVLLVAAIGAILLLLPTGEKAQQIPQVQQEETQEQEDLQQAMQQILSHIEGVGRVEVMLTLDSNGERVLASDASLRYSGSVQAPDQYDRTTSPVTVSGSEGEEIVITQEKYPTYRGALVVCDGGGNDRVRLMVVEAVSVLTGLGADCISVVPWQSDSIG